MAEFDERSIPAPRAPVDTIRVGDLRPWTVWTAAIVIAGLAVLGLYLGVRGGHPAAGVALALTQGEPLSPGSAASAAPAVALPPDQQWSTLSGPAVLPPSAAPAKSVASDDTDSGAEASGQTAAAAAIDDQQAAAPDAQAPPPEAAEPPAPPAAAVTTTPPPPPPKSSPPEDSGTPF
jgi:hypothetical protein